MQCYPCTHCINIYKSRVTGLWILLETCMLPYMNMVQVRCKFCDNEFYAKPSWLKKGNGKYCSTKCHHASARTGKNVACHICGKETYKTQKAIKGSNSGKFFCGKSCQTKWRNKTFVRELHPNWKGGTHSYRLLLLGNKSKPVCTLCKIKDVRVLAVHHIDENRANNTIENLAWLCHNCHHLVHHHPDEKVRFMAAIV